MKSEAGLGEISKIFSDVFSSTSVKGFNFTTHISPYLFCLVIASPSFD
jgi:hypothetical protein